MLHDLADIHDRNAEKFLGYVSLLPHGLRVYHICQGNWLNFFEERREKIAMGPKHFNMPPEMISHAHIDAEKKDEAFRMLYRGKTIEETRLKVKLTTNYLCPLQKQVKIVRAFDLEKAQ